MLRNWLDEMTRLDRTIDSAYLTIAALETIDRKKQSIGTMPKDIIKDVIFNNPATIVKWSDGTKTIVKCQEGDVYNKEIGLAMCIIKKMCGNSAKYNEIFKKWIKK